MPYPVREIETQWIAMPDGVRLAARVWLPEGAGRVPALLEYIPYRRRDLVRARDEQNHPWFAAHGYVCLRVDMRGSGDSEGTMPDMYAPHELADARQVIEWIAEQPWCDGKVGMFGTSWGGTASLQAAVSAPPALKAVLANCATTDRFEDDIHWMGGCLLTDSVEWGATLPAILAAPPDAATVGGGWREQWHRRISELACPLQSWLQHTTRGSYWRRGSVRFAADDLGCPVLTIGGWSDRYSNSVMKLVRQRPDLCWGMVGPWGHHYPDSGEPGPAISFQLFALQWWDYWLKQHDTGVADWPKLRLWRRQYETPMNRLSQRNGTWIELHEPAAGDVKTLFVAEDGLTESPIHTAQCLTIKVSPEHGADSGDTGYFGRVGGLPLNQVAEDARAVCFDTPPLDEPLDIVGSAVLQAVVTADAASAQLVCRLCDVAPDGVSVLICRGVINVALDEMLDHASASLTDKPIRLTLPATAYRLSAGHKLRLCLASSYWPLVWPSASLAELTINPSSVRLELPLAPLAMLMNEPLPTLADTSFDSLDNKSWQRVGSELSRFTVQREGRQLISGWEQPLVSTTYRHIGTTIGTATNASFRIDTDDTRRASCTFEHYITIQRADGVARITSAVTINSTAQAFDVDAKLTAYWNDEPEVRRDWCFEVPR